MFAMCALLLVVRISATHGAKGARNRHQNPRGCVRRCFSLWRKVCLLSGGSCWRCRSCPARGLYEPPRAALTGLDNLTLPAWLCFACAFLGITNPVLLGNKSFPVLCVGLEGRCKPPRGFGLENPLAYRHRLNNGA